MECIGLTLSAECPVALGSPLKVPAPAWKRWGVRWDSSEELESLVAISEEAYAREWQNSSAEGLSDISRAAIYAGLADCNKDLNAAVARVGGSALPPRGALAVLDIGAGTGDTAVALMSACPRLAIEAHWHLLDPSRPSLDQATQRIANDGHLDRSRLWLHQGTAMDMVALLGGRRFDLIVANASLHHNACLDRVFGLIHNLLKPEGILVAGDWHNSMWMEPGRVVELLSSLYWAGRDEDIRRFEAAFDTSVRSEELGPVRTANEQIAAFWRAYAEVRTLSAPQFEILEGHRPSADYTRLLVEAGFMDVVCEPLAAASDLLCVHSARKR